MVPQPLLQPLLRLAARVRLRPWPPRLTPTAPLLLRLLLVSLLVPMAAARVMSRAARSVASPPALRRAPSRVMSPASAPVPLAVMLKLRPVVMAGPTGVLVLVRLSKLELLAPMLALKVQPPVALPSTTLGMPSLSGPV